MRGTSRCVASHGAPCGAALFNSITVDGDTSTNDTVLAYAAGEPLPFEHHNALEQGLTRAMQQLARAIARDGEGATLPEVQVEGAADEAAAQAAASRCAAPRW